jgi:hypothetical protein
LWDERGCDGDDLAMLVEERPLPLGIAFAVQHRRLTRVVRTLAHPAVTASGVALGVATVVAGLRLDVGPWFETFASAAVPSKASRVVLTVTGSLTVVLVVASAAVRRNQRERVCAEQP